MKNPETVSRAYPGDPVFEAARNCARQGEPAILAGIVGVRGSSPRELGARLLVTGDRIVGSVGGGVLEHMVIQRGRTLLERGEKNHCLLSFPLGSDSQQCCGGVVVLFLEPLSSTDEAWLEALSGGALAEGVGMVTPLGPGSAEKMLMGAGKEKSRGLPQAVESWFQEKHRSDAAVIGDGQRQFLCEYLILPAFDVALFGAGHVGRALAAALAAHRCRLLWIDPREQEFPTPLPANAQALISDDVNAALEQVTPGSMILVMTHRHPLDYEICRRALQRGDFGFLGLIGSATKRRRFAKALVGDGIEESTAARLVCPIGITGLASKEPQVIAASAVAQLLLIVEGTRKVRRSKSIGISERTAEQSLVAGSFF